MKWLEPSKAVKFKLSDRFNKGKQIGGTIILLAFFAIVWIWMKKYAALDMPQKIAGSFRLIGYLFWINASWFLCGETARMHLTAFAGSLRPSQSRLWSFSFWVGSSC